MKILVAPETTEAQKKYLVDELQAEPVTVDPETAYYLFFQENKLRLQKRQSREHGVVVDFLEDQKNYQRQKISPKKDLLAKAVGVEPGLKVCDLTMGLAGDSFKLCYFGAKVTAIEENPLLVALVKDGQRRFIEGGHNLFLQIRQGSFQNFLEEMIQNHEVFYLDPMYEHDRTALPRKEMQYLAEISQPTPTEALQLVLDSCKQAKKKLVVKRAPQSKPICEVLPKRSVEGKMVRFDVYV